MMRIAPPVLSRSFAASLDELKYFQRMDRDASIFTEVRITNTKVSDLRSSRYYDVLFGPSCTATQH